MPGDGNRVMPPRALSRFQFHPSREPTGPRTRTPPSRCAAAALPRALAGPSQRKLGVLGRHATLPPFLASWRESTAEAPASRRPRRCVARSDRWSAAAARQATGVRSARRDGRTGPDQDPRTRALMRRTVRRVCRSWIKAIFASSSDTVYITVARAVRDSACLRARQHEIRRRLLLRPGPRDGAVGPRASCRVGGGGNATRRAASTSRRCGASARPAPGRARALGIWTIRGRRPPRHPRVFNARPLIGWIAIGSHGSAPGLGLGLWWDAGRNPGTLTSRAPRAPGSRPPKKISRPGPNTGKRHTARPGVSSSIYAAHRPRRAQAKAKAALRNADTPPS